MSGEGLDTIFFCSHCGDAAVLEEDGLSTVESGALLPSPGRHAQVWRPAWRLEARVRVHQRVRASGRKTEGWEGSRVFFVPAFDLPLEELTRLCRALSEAAETVVEVPREPIHGGTLASEDAVTLVRHILIGDEVRRSDLVASVVVDIEEPEFRLFAIPFERSKKALRCAVTGVTLRGVAG
jgi:hypothetical protein